MTLQQKITKAIENGNNAGAKKLASILLKDENKAEWNKARREEYDSLFPVYRDMTEEEKPTYFSKYREECDKQDELDGLTSGSTGIQDFETWAKLAPQVVTIDYSKDENSMTYDKWMLETKVESKLCPKCNVLDGEDSDCESCGGVGTIEVSESIRVYTPLKVTDEMALDKLSEYGYVPKEKVEAMKYLADTDWKIVRQAETGVLVDTETLDKRAAARSVL